VTRYESGHATQVPDPVGPDVEPSAQRDPFVLVHGSGHGGWCWIRVARLLRAAGHEVFTPTLTGHGERAHLLTADVRPATMVQDIVAVLENEELRSVVLVGHSFGALVTLGVADRVPHRLRRLVLLENNNCLIGRSRRT
jgi:pimeloyl-ACP methyl ester carboxylesterase